MFDFYLRMLPYVEERTKVQFRNTSTPITAGALYEETCTQFGLYNEVSPELRCVVRGLAWAFGTDWIREEAGLRVADRVCDVRAG
jgi:hypothetical protein